MAQRLWTPADLVGVTGLEIVDATRSVTTADGTFAAGTFVTGITAQRPAGGTATSIVSFRDDYRPVISAVNGKQSIFFDTSTRQLDIPTKTNLPNGTGDKFWFEVVKVAETRTDDRYTWGYGGGNQTAAAYKLRQGGVPYADVGSTGYAIGSVAVATTGISIITEQYTASDTTSRASYNGNATASTYKATRNSSLSQSAHFGNWPLYGNGSSHHLLRRGWGYGAISADDMARLQGRASWDSGDNGASLVDGHAYKAAAPTIDDGTGGASASGGATLGRVMPSAAAALAIAGAAALALAPLAVQGIATPAISGSGAVQSQAAGGNGVASPSAAGSSSVTLAALTASGGGITGLSATGAGTTQPVTGAGAGSSVPIVGGQGAVTLSPATSIGLASAGTTAAAAPTFGRITGAGSGSSAVTGGATVSFGSAASTGAASAISAGRSSVALAPTVSTGGAAMIATASGAVVLGTVTGAGAGSPPAPPIIVPAGRTLTLTTIGTRRLALTTTGSRRLTI